MKKGRVSGWLLLTAGLSSVVMAQQPGVPLPVIPAVWVPVRPIGPPATPLASETASAGVTRFSFLAYGDTRSGGALGVPGDGDVIHPEHSRIVDRMLAKARESAATPRRVDPCSDTSMQDQTAAS